ncbi:restriction endonuclease subunit S [Paucibacter sp. DJ1R-11]|uniref:restriction endonuclease subunit S n=1 Tax=Paucibacter sp. DJ1R-11 TaxID=2893556 RepID=UPI0021E3C2D3|nr:restriction endonuclease subunit S [Paucibacter sp. DJ1R-11]MCV2362486.1 restriction endonuclease subunit S [Paucibacter sp. DJ1R-11]
MTMRPHRGDWPHVRLRHHAALNPAPPRDLDDTDAVSFLPMEAIGEDGSLEHSRLKPVAEVQSGYSFFADGDVAFAKVTPCFENGKGALMRGLAGGVGFGTTELTVLRPMPTLDARFLHYIVSSEAFRRPGAGAMTGAGGLKRVPDEFTRNFRIPLPPKAEQAEVAQFLDRETASIDSLIEKKTRFIELLREKRQALITQAVTQGLDQSVPMKDSGVEWLGRVPAHWTIRRLVHIARIVRGASPRPAGDPRYFSKENELGTNIPWVTVAEITKDASPFLTSTASYLTPEGALNSQGFVSGTLLFSNSGATLGVPKILELDCCANDGVLAFRGLSRSVNIYFVYLYLCTTTERLREEMQKGGQPNLNTDTVKSIPIPIPDIEEQASLVAYVKEACERIGALSTATESSICLLRERRSALITAAVTGQIDLRETA